MNMSELKNKTFLDEIYVLKGIAIIGVVILHLYVSLISDSFYYLSVKIIAQFSIPMFMFTSGFLYGYSRTEVSDLSNYIDLIIRKFRRLMVPYFIISGIIIILKYLAESHVALIFPVDQNFWKYLLFNPIKGFAPFLWYLYVLFIVLLIFPLLNRIIQNSSFLLLLIFILYIIPIPEFFYFNHELIRGFLLLFCLGYICSNRWFDKINLFGPYLFIISLVLLVIIIMWEETINVAMSNIFGHNNIMSLLFKLLSECLALLTYYCFSILITKRCNWLARGLKYLGMYAASIYLLHSISMGAVRIVFIDILQPNENLYYLISILLFISGIIVPVLITKYIMNRSKTLSLLILGVRSNS